MFRVTQATYYRQAINELLRMEYGQGVLNEQINSGKKINRASDDPVLLIPGQTAHRTLEELAQYKDSVDHALTWIQQSESKMQAMNELIAQATNYAEQLSTGTYSEEQRGDLSSQIQNIIESLVSLGNTSVNGSHIFGGTQTSLQAVTESLRVKTTSTPESTNVGDGNIYARGQYTGLLSRSITVTVTGSYDSDPDTTDMPVSVSYIDDYGRTVSFNGTISGSGSGNAIDVGDGVQIYAEAESYKAGDVFTVEVGRNGGNEEILDVNLSWANRMQYNYTMDLMFGSEGNVEGDWQNLLDMLTEWRDALEKDSQTQDEFKAIGAVTNNPGSTAELNVGGAWDLLESADLTFQVGGPFQFINDSTDDDTISARQYQFYLEDSTYSGQPTDENPLVLHYRYDSDPGAGTTWVDGGTITIDGSNGNNPDNAISLNDDADVQFYLADGYYDVSLIPEWTNENNAVSGEGFEVYSGPVDADSTSMKLTYSYVDDAGVRRWNTIDPVSGTDQEITLDITDSGDDPVLTISANGTFDDGDYWDLNLSQYQQGQTMSQEMLPKLEDAMNRMLSQISDAGARQNRLTVREVVLDDDYLLNIDILERVESTDYTTALTDLSMLETLYKASLSSTGAISRVTLANYL